MPIPGAWAEAPPSLVVRLLIASALGGSLIMVGIPDVVGGRPAVVDPPLHPGQPYAEARLALQTAGWKPRPRTTGTMCSALIPDRRCQRHPELQSCSQTGPGFCRFEWISPLGVPLAVITTGGDPGGDPGRLSRWFTLP